MIEAFFVKTLGTIILRSAVTHPGFRDAATAIGKVYKVFTTFNRLYSVSSVKELGITGLQVDYEYLSDRAIDYLVNKIVEDRYEIQCRESGLYVAKTRLAPHPVFLAAYEEFESLVHSGFDEVKVDLRIAEIRRTPLVKDLRSGTFKRDHRKA